MKKVLLIIKLYLKTTLVLIGINLIMYLLTLVLSIFFSANSSLTLVFLGAEYTPSILQGEVWRLVTASFLHASSLHLLINMWALFTFGNYIERFYSGKKLFAIYIVTGITGSLVSVIANILTAYSSNQAVSGYAVSVGASAAIFGLIGVMIGNHLRKNNYSLPLPINTAQLWLFVGYNLIIGFGINTFGGGININNWAHIGGLVGGIILGILLDPKTTFYRSRPKKILEQTLFIISLVIFILSFIANFISFISLFLQTQ